MTAPADRYQIEVAYNANDLERYRAAWEDLVANAADANVFYEPFNLLAAIKAFGSGKDSRFLLIVRDTGEHGQVELAGFFPMEFKSRFRGAPLGHLVAWQHAQLYLATPLVRRGCGREAWRALLRWTRLRSHECAVLEWPLTLGGSETMRTLHEALKAEGATSTVVDRFERSALTRSASDAEDYAHRFISTGSRREWRRKRRRLSERGKVEVRSLQRAEDAGPWLDRFLAMEASGWKGETGSALVADTSEARYFRSICMSAHAASRLHMLALFLDDVPIAMQCNLFTSGGAFALKVAYDETFSKYSPGALLELENIADMFRRSDFIWMDSCTRGDHPLMHRMWHDRRTIEHVLVSSGGFRGRLAVALYPALQRVKRGVDRIRHSVAKKGQNRNQM